MAETLQITDKIVENAIVSSLRNVFWTMLHHMPSLKASGLEAIPSDADMHFEVIGCVGFAGDVNGIVYLCLTEEFARQSTAQILGMSLAEVDMTAPEVIKDAVGEVTNMTAGGFKNELCDLGYPCKLGLPTFLRGRSLAVASTKSAARHVFWFECNGHRLAADILLKSE
ncbi:MAG TPA: chemotaxis protein CheX [Candidatus Didemnitutus sp.]|jgi:chemotaxis protein CheX